MTSVELFAPAKVNLFLEVLSKRGDGYHELETLLVAVSLYDTLVFTEESTGAIQLQCSQRDLSTGPDNLIVRAADYSARSRWTSVRRMRSARRRFGTSAWIAASSSSGVMSAG